MNTRERTVRVYFEDRGRRLLRGSATIPPGAVPTSVSVPMRATKVFAFPGAPGRLIVTMDTRDAGAARTLTTTLQTLVWTDLVTRTISDVMDLPLVSNTLSY